MVVPSDQRPCGKPLLAAMRVSKSLPLSLIACVVTVVVVAVVAPSVMPSPSSPSASTVTSYSVPLSSPVVMAVLPETSDSALTCVSPVP